MEDLFQAAGINPTVEQIGGTGRHARRNVDEDTFGGHNLRQAIPVKTRADGTQVIPRPRSRIAAAPSQSVLRDLADEEEFIDKLRPAPTKRKHNDDEYNEGDDDGDEYSREEDSGDDEGYSEDDEVDAIASTSRQKGARFDIPPTSTAPTAAVQSVAPTKPPPLLANLIPLTCVKPHSMLGQAAAAAFTTAGFSLTRELGWQSAVAGDNARSKSFRQEVTQQVDLTAFGFMRPSSPYVQILHSVATYAVRGGSSDLHNMDFGFIGDRTDFKLPTPVTLDEKIWKWEKKTMGLDVPPLEDYYAKPGNAKFLYHDDASGGEKTVVPQIIYLPPPFLVYCLEEQRTPFQLHQFATTYATRDGSEVTIKACELLTDWCFMASHRTAIGAPTTSMLAISLPAAPSDDDDFLRWLYKVDCTRSDAAVGGPTATSQAPPIAVAAAPPVMTAPPGPPGPDVWEQMAKNISSSFATAAAALKPAPTNPDDESYESGGRPFDKFQMATIQGFAHVTDITGVPLIWALFQYTKNMETHKDNIRRRMVEWATDPTREVQVHIERSWYIPNSTLKEILTLNFNPGGILAEADAADLGMSILICRTRTVAAKTAIRKYEKALENSRRSRSMAEAEAELNKSPAYDSGALPDNYYDLLRCIGTYCALLYTLFGPRCVFYRQCYALWTEMNSDLVHAQRDDFSALYCRQIVWAVLMESRIYFSQRLSVEDFLNVHPDDVKFPRSNLHKVVTQVRDMEPIVRSSFPAAWYPAGTGRAPTVALANNPSVGTGAPVQSISAPATGAPSVVSGLTAATPRTPRPPVTIRATDVHPRIKTVMEPCIAKNKGVWLGAMLNHLNITIDDLPRLPPDVSGAGSLCYNFILGHCKMEGCQHEHAHARDLTDEFVTDLLAKLKPGIDEFTTNGLPPGTRRRHTRSRRGRA